MKPWPDFTVRLVAVCREKGLNFTRFFEERAKLLPKNLERTAKLYKSKDDKSLLLKNIWSASARVLIVSPKKQIKTIDD